MKTQFTHPRQLAVAATAILLGAFVQNVSAGGWTPMRLHGTATIQSIVPIGGDEHVVRAEVVATEIGSGNVWGDHTSVWQLVVDFDAITFEPLRGGGEIVQTNADGSTLTWQTRFEGNWGFSTITAGTGRFEHAIGGSRDKTVQNEDGTFSYQAKGWIAGIESDLGAGEDEEEDGE